MEEFWIGDRVRIKGTARVGIYEGPLGHDMAKVRFDAGYEAHPVSHLMLVEEEEPVTVEMLFDEEEETFDLKTSLTFQGFIDLHIDKLREDHSRMEPGAILLYQKRQCQVFIEKAIAARKATAEIIHGRGEGILREEVKHILDSFRQVAFYRPLNEGSLEVYFSYDR